MGAGLKRFPNGLIRLANTFHNLEGVYQPHQCRVLLVDNGKMFFQLVAMSFVKELTSMVCPMGVNHTAKSWCGISHIFGSHFLTHPAECSVCPITWFSRLNFAGQY